jgi:hypothetical protein
MKTPEERYIFNAITGNLIEIQNLNWGILWIGIKQKPY